MALVTGRGRAKYRTSPRERPDGALEGAGDTRRRHVRVERARCGHHRAAAIAHAPRARRPAGLPCDAADFLRALRTGAPALFTLEMARRDLLLLEQAERSMVGGGDEGRVNSTLAANPPMAVPVRIVHAS